MGIQNTAINARSEGLTTPHVADGTRPTERGRSLGERMSRQKYFCDLTMVECEHGGSQRFNLGFMHGTESACRHPKIDRKGRSLFLWDGRPRFPCPIGLPAKEDSAKVVAR